jgi:hypothetical protein
MLKLLVLTLAIFQMRSIVRGKSDHAAHAGMTPRETPKESFDETPHRQ